MAFKGSKILKRSIFAFDVGTIIEGMMLPKEEINLGSKGKRDCAN